MANLSFNNVKITGISACVPKNISRNEDLTNLIPPEEIKKTINHIGIYEKRFVDPDVTASDLSYKAAEKLIKDMNIDKNTIDVLIFMSQTPDYITPATAPILQHRLGLSTETAAFDINLACSGYVYSLSTAFLYASQPNINKVLLLNGETFSKIVSPKDKVNAPLYGDAGTATLIEKQDNQPSHFVLNSDGTGAEAVKIPAGGARKPADANTIIETKREDGNIRTDHQIYMNGVDVFNFTMLRVPKSIKTILKQTNTELMDIDNIVFHQANKFMTDFFIKKLKYSTDRVPYSLGKYGNTSSSSIPLTIASEIKTNENKKNIILCGFGGGLSWATALLSLENCSIFKPIEY